MFSLVRGCIRDPIVKKSAIRIPRFAILICLPLCSPPLSAQGPDLTGTWSNTIVTPLERPRILGDRAFFTEAEAKEFESPDKIYERWKVSVEDPASFARPWTAVWTMTRMTERLFEYACHEANYSMEMTLKGARAQEKDR